MSTQPNLKLTRPPARGAAIDLSGETFGKAVAVCDGVWVIATRHKPGLSKHMFEVNNRCVVFRLDDKESGRPVLLVANATDPATAIPEVRRLERETGLVVRTILSPGGGHHLMLEPWHDEFTTAKVLVPPVRIPRIAHGRKLMQLPRVAAMDLHDPLPQFRGQLDAAIFHGLLGQPDSPTPGEGAKDTFLGLWKRMLKFMIRKPSDPVDELWLHHTASGTVIGGENLGWYYTATHLKTAHLMLKSMIKPDRVYIWTVPRRVGDAATVAACWRKILSWPARTLMTYHDTLTVAFAGDVRGALTAAVEEVGQLPKS